MQFSINRIFIIAFLLLDFKSFAQVESEAYRLQKTTLQQELHYCNAWGNRDYDEIGELNIDSIMNSAATRLTSLLQFQEARNFDPSEFETLHLSLKTEDQTRIRIYNIVFSSGGSMGDYILPVLQWEGMGSKLCAHNLSTTISLNFNSPPHSLMSDSVSRTYIITGSRKVSTTSWISTALLLRFEGDTVILNTPVFAMKNSLCLRNTSMSYNDSTNVLHIQVESFDLLEAQLSVDTMLGRQLYDLILMPYNSDQNYPTDNGIDLKWDGQCFVNVGPAIKPDER